VRFGERANAVLGPLPYLLAIGAVLAAEFSWVRATNFGGVDEWLYLSLNSRGIVAFPHSNRPLTLIWSQPAVWLAPYSFHGYFLLHAAYLALGAGLVVLICRRLTADPGLALLAGVFAAAWAPLDMARLAAVQTSMNSGVLLGTLLALLLLIVSWERARVPALAAGCLMGLVAARSYEAVLALLLGAPVLLLFVRSGLPGRAARAAWLVAWEASAVLALVLAALPLLAKQAESAYQSEVLGLDLAPARYLGRFLRQYALHLGPLVPADPRELLHPGVAAAAALFAASWWILGLVRPVEEPREPPSRLAALAGLGLALAGLGYAVLVASPQVQGATRTQFLAAPGVALFLAASLVLTASALPPRIRGAALLLGGAGVVAVGTGHTIAMQREWDRISYYDAQVSTLRQLTGAAPDLTPNTLVLLRDETRAWPYSFSFRHAVSYLYQGKAVGYALGANPLLYSLAATPEGIWSVPWPVIEKPWRTAPTLHRYDEVVAFRRDASGRLFLLEGWDETGLPPLPAGAHYDPRPRIELGKRPPPERRVLDAPGVR